jgi:hypothetical protein
MHLGMQVPSGCSYNPALEVNFNLIKTSLIKHSPSTFNRTGNENLTKL